MLLMQMPHTSEDLVRRLVNVFGVPKSIDAIDDFDPVQFVAELYPFSVLAATLKLKRASSKSRRSASVMSTASV